MARRMDYPRGRVDVQCIDCGTIYEFFNHESFYIKGETDRCPSCGSVNYKRAYRTMPIISDRMKLQAEIPWYFRDRLDDPNREPMTYNEARARAVGHWQETGEYVTPEDVMKEVNTKWTGFYVPNRKPAEGNN